MSIRSHSMYTSFEKAPAPSPVYAKAYPPARAAVEAFAATGSAELRASVARILATVDHVAGGGILDESEADHTMDAHDNVRTKPVAPGQKILGKYQLLREIKAVIEAEGPLDVGETRQENANRRGWVLQAFELLTAHIAM
jgi:hypothetical protein